MPLGDFLSEEDYARLYNDHPKPERWIPALTIIGWLVCLILVGSILGCDSQASENTFQAEQEAHQKKLELLSMPCTWVAQCGNPISACPVEKRKCVDAVLSGGK